ncbi:MAG TPA: sugar ABC transporter substrate-binding protein [Solirubrobacterales bacterium]|nr:sugar ABC transporter substrate-binding protein [Solirubrobacterales bacterium]
MSSFVGLRRASVLLVALLAISFTVAACGDDDDGGGSGDGGGPTIALLLPENQTPRYESADRPYFEERVEEICPDCEILYSNATEDASKQQSQVEAALTQGADVLVLDPVDAASAASSVQRASQQDVPVLSYDRLILGAPGLEVYVSFDNVRVGELQAEALVKKLKEDGSPKGPIVKINGDPADSNAALFKEGSNKGFETAGVEVAREYDTPGWLASNAQNEMQQAITALGKDGFAGVYAANDDTGGGAIAAMKGAGIDPAERPTTGQDATVAGVQRILAGQQYMTVYKAIKPQASISAEIAVDLAEGKQVPQDKITDQLDNEAEKVPSILLEPVAVTKDNIKQTVIADEFITPDELCTDAYAKACEEAGIS